MRCQPRLSLMRPVSSSNFGWLGPVLAAAMATALAGCAASTGPTVAPPTPAVETAPPVAPAPAPAPSQQPLPLTAEQRRVQTLVEQVERAFRSGDIHYHKGQLVQAKMDFDSAVDMMLASGLDLKGDPILNDEFNRILDAINALEMEALKQGNGFAPTVEPAPADVANDVTFEVDPNLVAKAREELATTKSDLPLVINDYVAGYINFFANSQRGHNTLKHSLQRGGRYKAMIQKVLGDEGVPQDLIYLAVAESGFQPQAVNGRSGAGGMWQFMPHGDYGLTRNAYVDERFDPVKSTRAYGRYMKFLYNQLGDWYLAMAAYDWGAGNVQRAVQKTGYADYWELYKRNNLPGETKNYVPEILAAIIIAKNPTQYGFDDVEFDPAVELESVPIEYSVDIRLVADLLDIQPQQIVELNPGLLRFTTPPPSTLSEPFDLHLPKGMAALYTQRIAAIPEDKRTQWRYHRVKPEDTLASLAQNYHLTVDQIAAANNLQRDTAITNLDGIVIPLAPVVTATHTELYKARRGDTLVTIADRFGVSLDELHRWNHLTSNTIVAGQKIRVQAPLRLAPQTRDHSRTTHATSSAKGKESAAANSKTQQSTPQNTKKNTQPNPRAGSETPSNHAPSSAHARRGHRSSHGASTAAKKPATKKPKANSK